MKSFNKIEAAVFSCRLCFLRTFPFISLILEKSIETLINPRKEKNPRKHSLHEKIQQFLLKLFISGHEKCHSIDAP